jgi:hypothetical protein
VSYEQERADSLSPGSKYSSDNDDTGILLTTRGRQTSPLRPTAATVTGKDIWKRNFHMLSDVMNGCSDANRASAIEISQELTRLLMPAKRVSVPIVLAEVSIISSATYFLDPCYLASLGPIECVKDVAPYDEPAYTPTKYLRPNAPRGLRIPSYKDFEWPARSFPAPLPESIRWEYYDANGKPCAGLLPLSLARYHATQVMLAQRMIALIEAGNSVHTSTGDLPDCGNWLWADDFHTALSIEFWERECIDNDANIGAFMRENSEDSRQYIRQRKIAEHY